MQITIRNKEYTARPTTTNTMPIIALIGEETITAFQSNQLSEEEFRRTIVDKIRQREYRADLAGCLVDVTGGDIVAEDGEVLVSYESRQKYTLWLELDELLLSLASLLTELKLSEQSQPVKPEPEPVKVESAGKGFGDAIKSSKPKKVEDPDGGLLEQWDKQKTILKRQRRSELLNELKLLNAEIESESSN